MKNFSNEEVAQWSFTRCLFEMCNSMWEDDDDKGRFTKLSVFSKKLEKDDLMSLPRHCCLNPDRVSFYEEEDSFMRDLYEYTEFITQGESDERVLEFVSGLTDKCRQNNIDLKILRENVRRLLMLKEVIMSSAV